MTDLHALLAPLRPFAAVMAIKLYRLTMKPPLEVPSLPCLDHEAMLHATVDPHLAAYVQERSSGDLHELVFIPAKQRIDVDRVSTWGESSDESHVRLVSMLRAAYSDWRIRVVGPSWWRGERRVAEACRAQVTLREVLLAADIPAVATRVHRLQTISSLMEKESRVASWGVRTVTGPLLSAAAVLTFLAIGSLGSQLGESMVTALRYGVVSLLGGVFLYYGLKAVQLTEMANRVWKRTAEYSLILSERQRLARAAPTSGASSGTAGGGPA